MREILFRGKDLDGEWQEGSVVFPNHELPNNAGLFMEGNAFICTDLHGVISENHDLKNYSLSNFLLVMPSTVGQYTGYCDKNGKKVYEGDICLCDRNIGWLVDRQRFVIKFSEEIGAWIGATLISEIDASQFELCEVIGNIYDNPELLEVDV